MDNTEKLSVLIAEDHTLVRHGIKLILDATNRYQVVGEAESADQTLELIESLKPDILLIDLGLSGKSGVEALYEIKAKGIPLTIAVLSMSTDENVARQARQAGAMTCISNDFNTEDLVNALDRAIDGERTVSPAFSHILQALEQPKQKDPSNDPLAKLSRREREVFFLLAEGMPNRAIAKKLFISSRTVETHRARVIKKLEFKSTADLVKFGIKNNLLMP